MYASQGFQPYLRARFDDVCVTAQRIEITPFESLSEPATALRNAMQQLGCLQVQKGTVAISGWALTRDAARAVADTMPTLPDISIEWCASEALTDQQLRRLLRTVPQLRRLSVPSLNLQSDQHANTPWPWEELAVSECDAAMLLRLPNPGGEGAPRVVRCESITLDANKLNGVSCTHTTHQCIYSSPSVLSHGKWQEHTSIGPCIIDCNCVCVCVCV